MGRCSQREMVGVAVGAAEEKEDKAVDTSVCV